MVYDRSEPLFFIHVPKTAGRSVRFVFQQWYPDLLLHYANQTPARLPGRTPAAGDVVFGHFNRLLGFGIEAHFPQARQFMTILRDPFEMAVSSYFYAIKKGQEQLRSIEEIIDAPLNMLAHFPVTVTETNYRAVLQSFLYVGTTERLADSMRAIAAILGKEYIPPGRENVTVRSGQYDHLRDAFTRRHQLECEVYAHARAIATFRDGAA